MPPLKVYHGDCACWAPSWGNSRAPCSFLPDLKCSSYGSGFQSAFSQICISHAFPEKQNQWGGTLEEEREGEMNWFPGKELAYMVVEVSKSEICRAGNSGRTGRCSVEEEFLLFQGNLRVLLLRPFTDWMRTSQIVEDNHYSQMAVEVNPPL